MKYKIFYGINNHYDESKYIANMSINKDIKK